MILPMEKGRQRLGGGCDGMVGMIIRVLLIVFIVLCIIQIFRNKYE
jgi:uncharacterized membrane protein